ncbi:hypothetical protein HMPREF3192_01135 [Atopobium deltae]|uniref:Uncharacterized protein n=1 Tax=Atopobium deltae TaxID=1393034 RepID=A0A133XSI4_9ACTN|nr:hypothetical protein HMPREF3192_01135 [Atopobium deltae]
MFTVLPYKVFVCTHKIFSSGMKRSFIITSTRQEVPALSAEATDIQKSASAKVQGT